jgi:hypothetical protein
VVEGSGQSLLVERFDRGCGAGLGMSLPAHGGLSEPARFDELLVVDPFQTDIEDLD